MKLRSLIGLTAMAAIVMGLAACEWSSSGDNDTTFTRYDGWNFSGSYRASEDSGSAYTQVIAQQDGRNLTLVDNRGGRYTGKITKQSSRPWTPDTSTAEDPAISAYAPASSSLKYYFVTASFEVSGTSYRGRQTTVVGTFETVQFTSTENSTESVSSLLAATFVEQGAGSSSFTGASAGISSQAQSGGGSEE